MFKVLMRACRGRTPKTAPLASMNLSSLTGKGHVLEIRENEKSARDVQVNVNSKTESFPASERTPFNREAIQDLFLMKFDDLLLFFPDIMTLEKWNDLIDRGQTIEENLRLLNYQDILSTGNISPQVRQLLAKLGLFKPYIPPEYGGFGYSETERTYFHEIISVYPSIARVLAENEELGIKILSKFGTEEQKRKYLPKLATGESMIALALLEESASVMDIKNFFGLESIQVDGDIILKGEKKWVYNGPMADLFIVFGANSEKTEGRVTVLDSLYLVERSAEGVIVRKPLKKSWFKGMEVCDVIFNEVRVTRDSVIGGVGNGAEIIREVVCNNRTGMVAESSAMLKRLLGDAIEKSLKNTMFDKPLAELSSTEVPMSNLGALTYAAESLAYYLAARADYYENPDLSLEALLSKIYVANILPEALQMYFNMLGRFGYERGSFVEELTQNVHFYSVINDTSNDILLYIAHQCMLHLAKNKKDHVKKLKDPMNYPFTSLITQFKLLKDNEEIGRPLLNLGQCLPSGFDPPANILEYCIQRLSVNAELLLIDKGKDVLNEHHSLVVLSLMLVEIYALIAVIARASKSTSIRRERKDHWDDFEVIDFLSKRTLSKVREYSKLLQEGLTFSLDIRAEIGRKLLENKEYHLQHPLMRNF